MANVIVDHFARVEQSLNNLNLRACKMGEQVQSLEQQFVSQLSKLVLELDKEITQPRKYVPLSDREEFYQWNKKHLKDFYRTLFKLFLETRQYESLIHKYHGTTESIKEEVAHV
ncbi:hypothetical protein [Rickettsiella endosymbiont of Miltochrista miniata]|uniref:hypothetical protein n=1 Tax=Rickettsiella endosymbiont of Miltochrista miniata TaxID=3066239 RepID=UPI00313DA895